MGRHRRVRKEQLLLQPVQVLNLTAAVCLGRMGLTMVQGIVPLVRLVLTVPGDIVVQLPAERAKPLMRAQPVRKIVIVLTGIMDQIVRRVTQVSTGMEVLVPAVPKGLTAWKGL